MVAKQYNFTLDQGKKRTMTLTLKDANRQPIPLNTYSAEMNIALRTGSTRILSLTTSHGDIVLGANGTIIITILPTQTTLLRAPEYKYEVKLIKSSSDIEGIIYGKITVNSEV